MVGGPFSIFPSLSCHFRQQQYKTSPGPPDPVDNLILLLSSLLFLRTLSGKIGVGASPAMPGSDISVDHPLIALHETFVLT